MSRPIRLYLSSKNLAHNFRVAKRHAPGSKIMAVVKANAYGFGVNWASLIFTEAGADALAVCSIDEALKINNISSLPLVMLEGFFSKSELEKIISLKLIPVIHSDWQLEALKSQKLKKELNIIIKINTGMNRLGFNNNMLECIYNKLSEIKNINIFAVMSHFAMADDIKNPENSEQLIRFKTATPGIDAKKTMANSAAILSTPDAHFDWVRPGIMLYGSNPFISGSYKDYDLLPVMRFESEIIALKDIDPGDTVGYGGVWRASKKTKIAVVAAGYADGYPRHAPGGTPVAVNGQLATLAGRVSMDMLTVDVGGLSQVKIGDQVELWGDIVPVDEVAKHASTIAYELFCSVTERVPRIYE